jgi:hypothetical protein
VQKPQDTPPGFCRTEMRIFRALSVVLALLAGVFGVLGLISSVRQVRMCSSWPKVDATVEEISVHPIADNAYGNISVEFSYSSGSKKSAWANKSFLTGRGARFAREYAVGTRHIIWLEPVTFERAEMELGWNLETLLVPLILWGFCLCLLLGAMYFWRVQKDQ